MNISGAGSSQPKEMSVHDTTVYRKKNSLKHLDGYLANIMKWRKKNEIQVCKGILS
jgi:hypothetical protein